MDKGLIHRTSIKDNTKVLLAILLRVDMDHQDKVMDPLTHLNNLRATLLTLHMDHLLLLLPVITLLPLIQGQDIHHHLVNSHMHLHQAVRLQRAHPIQLEDQVNQHTQGILVIHLHSLVLIILMLVLAHTTLPHHSHNPISHNHFQIQHQHTVQHQYHNLIGLLNHLPVATPHKILQAQVMVLLQPSLLLITLVLMEIMSLLQQ